MSVYCDYIRSTNSGPHIESSLLKMRSKVIQGRAIAIDWYLSPFFYYDYLIRQRYGKPNFNLKVKYRSAKHRYRHNLVADFNSKYVQTSNRRESKMALNKLSIDSLDFGQKRVIMRYVTE